MAELYGVETKRVNEAVSNNPEKFPEGYVWELTEVEDLMTDVLPVQSSETSFELNLAMLKFKHSVKRSTDDERIVRLEEENAELKRKLGEKPD